MRWPIRNQILLPLLGLLIASLVCVTIVYTNLAVVREKDRIKSEITNLFETVTETRIPLSENVLYQMKSLTGADFALELPIETESNDSKETLRPHQISDSTFKSENFSLPESISGRVQELNFDVASQLRIEDQNFFHASARVRNNLDNSIQIFHVLYPQTSYAQARSQAIYPPIIVGAFAIALSSILSFWLISALTRPIQNLQSQVGKIAAGDFSHIQVVERNDEIADLSKAINTMTQSLQRYQVQIRKNEQLRTIGQLGGGIAHQIRNSITGCRLAMEIHNRKCPKQDDEGMKVAMRQLTSIEDYLKRFLALGKPEPRETKRFNITEICSQSVQLISPSAEHVGVQLTSSLPSEPVEFNGDADAITQMLTNILLNGVEAAANLKTDSSNSPFVELVLSFSDPKEIVITIVDNGAGPSDRLSEDIFEALVSDKADGTGLGLSVAKEAAARHDGTIKWFRRFDQTHFEIRLPQTLQETNS